MVSNLEGEVTIWVLLEDGGNKLERGSNLDGIFIVFSLKDSHGKRERAGRL